jgi:cytoplasmic iron level regulating protein YaaA (DUF328/UPF0246 family)
MLALISPSKTLDFETEKSFGKSSLPLFKDDTKKLVGELQKLSQKELSKLMNISEKLAELNYQRFKNFDSGFKKNTKQAIFAFKGDVYEGIDVESLKDKELKILGEKTAILSGLYGILKPFDVMQAYRLEMGTGFKNSKGANLYKFWDNKVTEAINKIESKTIVNLASNEYFKVVDQKLLKAKLVNIDFKEFKNGKYSVIGIFAKRARGLMVRYIAQNNIDKYEDLRDFNLENYKYNRELSKENNLVFTRK